ncbi:MAG: N(G),N(G)-dimethylarginine dimethylaminohydrolase [Bacteroidia bacterium]|nr:N(G),N(G)-dimethylarginine dimethylaminohydrolase [Bacteroidia bacterium]
MFTRAIVRLPSRNLKEGLSSSDLGIPDYEEALTQHAAYISSLKKLGIDVTILEANVLYPDSVFIEDAAICDREFAVITRPGAPTRRGETGGLKEVLDAFFSHTEVINSPGTIEGGDVMKVNDHYYIGISARTNHNGADQFIRILNTYGLTGEKVQLEKILHLKTGISYLEKDYVLVSGELADCNQFSKYKRIIVKPEESYAANSIWLNGVVLVPEGFPDTRRKIEKSGFETLAINTSEFRKLDGGLSCLSLRF